MCSISIDILFEPLNNLLGGWPLYFGIKESYRNQKVLKEFTDGIIFDLYKKGTMNMTKIIKNQDI